VVGRRGYLVSIALEPGHCGHVSCPASAARDLYHCIETTQLADPMHYP
jgi:hypothetical protein